MGITNQALYEIIQQACHNTLKVRPQDEDAGYEEYESEVFRNLTAHYNYRRSDEPDSRESNIRNIMKFYFLYRKNYLLFMKAIML